MRSPTVLANPLWAGICIGLLPAVLPAQTPNLELEGGDITFAVDANIGLPLEDFIRIAEVMTNTVIEYDPAVVGGPMVSFEGAQTMRRAEFIEFFELMTYRWGFLCKSKSATDATLVVQRGVSPDWPLTPHKQFTFEVLPAKVQTVDSKLLESLGAKPEEPDPKTRLLASFKTQSEAAALAGRVRPIAPREVELGISGDNDAVFLQGPRGEVHIVASLLRRLDQPADAVEIVLTSVDLRFVVNHVVAEHIQALLSAEAQRVPPDESYAPVLVFPGKNGAIVLCGTFAQVDQARELIAVLDRPVR